MTNMKTKMLTLMLTLALPLAFVTSSQAGVVDWTKKKTGEAKDAAVSTGKKAVEEGKKAAKDTATAAGKAAKDTAKAAAADALDVAADGKSSTTASEDEKGSNKENDTPEKPDFKCTTDYCNKTTCKDDVRKNRCTACKTMTDAKGNKQTMSPTCKTAESTQEVDTSDFECTTKYCSSTKCKSDTVIKWCSDNCQKQLPKMSQRCIVK